MDTEPTLDNNIKNKLKKLGFEALEFKVQPENQFFVSIKGIPSHLISKIKLPALNKSGRWGTFTLTVFNPQIEGFESNLISFFTKEQFNNHEVEVKLLTPEGDQNSVWKILGKLEDLSFSELDWNSREPQTIKITFSTVQITIE